KGQADAIPPDAGYLRRYALLVGHGDALHLRRAVEGDQHEVRRWIGGALLRKRHPVEVRCFEMCSMQISSLHMRVGERAALKPRIAEPGSYHLHRRLLSLCVIGLIVVAAGEPSPHACQRQVAEVLPVQYGTPQVHAHTPSLRSLLPVHRPARSPALMRCQQPFNISTCERDALEGIAALLDVR